MNILLECCDFCKGRGVVSVSWRQYTECKNCQGTGYKRPHEAEVISLYEAYILKKDNEYLRKKLEDLE